MQIKVDLSENSAKTVIESLLQTIKDKDEQLIELEYQSRSYSSATSMLSSFLAEKHPELTTDLATFISKQVDEDGYDFGMAVEAGFEATLRHTEVLSNKELDDLHKRLNETRLKNQTIRDHEKKIKSRM